ncbi:hypothetical protein [Nostoc sp. WHI]|nr:hypothetical protein [Nostoc sp. WHI]
MNAFPGGAWERGNKIANNIYSRQQPNEVHFQPEAGNEVLKEL